MPSDDPTTKLIALKCDGCGKLYVPPRYLCSECGNSEFSEIALEGKGKVYTYTTIRMPFEEFQDEAPYAFAEVKSDEGLV